MSIAETMLELKNSIIEIKANQPNTVDSWNIYTCELTLEEPPDYNTYYYYTVEFVPETNFDYVVNLRLKDGTQTLMYGVTNMVVDFQATGYAPILGSYNKFVVPIAKDSKRTLIAFSTQPGMLRFISRR